VDDDSARSCVRRREFRLKYRRWGRPISIHPIAYCLLMPAMVSRIAEGEEGDCWGYTLEDTAEHDSSAELYDSAI
jgi:hypothetical protein